MQLTTDFEKVMYGTKEQVAASKQKQDSVYVPSEEEKAADEERARKKAEKNKAKREKKKQKAKEAKEESQKVQTQIADETQDLIQNLKL